MVCSTCGYDNQVGNRFCGMCGTPLPHRPLTTPGAQSTASLTRPLVENVGPGESTASSGPRAHTSLEVAPHPQTSDDPEAETPASEPLSELVPEIPLDDYIQNFHYTPPSDPQERTMRGDAPVLRPEAPEPSNGNSGPSIKTSTATTSPIEMSTVKTEEPPSASADDVRERLGLDVNNIPEERIDRPRFLDINQPSTPIKPGRTVQSIAGPSFLGLNDPPPVEVEADDEAEPDEPSRWKWRMLLAAAVVVVFGWLGVLEWQAQVGQANNGPVEVIKLKMRSLRQGNNGGAEPASDSASKPEMRVVPPKGRKQNPTPEEATATPGQGANAAAAPNENATSTPPASTAPAATGNQPGAVQSETGQAQKPGMNTGQPTAAPPQKPEMSTGGTAAEQNPTAAARTTPPPMTTVEKAKSSVPQQAAPAAAAVKPKPTRQSADDNEEVVVRKIVPGAEEMAKADNASDSAAEAAWLWKATAKGNPTAPVRLADMYVKGVGVPRSCEQALVLLKTAAAKENSMARNQLASMYGSGVCVTRDRVEAYRWVSLALTANPNSEWAQQRRNLLWQQMTPNERIQAAKYR